MKHMENKSREEKKKGDELMIGQLMTKHYEGESERGMIGQFTLEKREGERMIIGQVNNEKLGKDRERMLI